MTAPTGSGEVARDREGYKWACRDGQIVFDVNSLCGGAEIWFRPDAKEFAPTPELIDLWYGLLHPDIPLFSADREADAVRLDWLAEQVDRQGSISFEAFVGSGNGTLKLDIHSEWFGSSKRGTSPYSQKIREAIYAARQEKV